MGGGGGEGKRRELDEVGDLIGEFLALRFAFVVEDERLLGAVPEADRAVVAGRGHELAVVADGQRPDLTVMSRQRHHALEVVRVPL